MHRDGTTAGAPANIQRIPSPCTNGRLLRHRRVAAAALTGLMFVVIALLSDFGTEFARGQTGLVTYIVLTHLERRRGDKADQGRGTQP